MAILRDSETSRRLTIDADVVAVNGVLSATDIRVDGMSLEEYVNKIIGNETTK